MCCEVLPQYVYVLRAYLTVKTYVLRGVLERQTRRRGRGCDAMVRPSSGRAVNLGVFLQLNLPRTAGKLNAVTSKTLSTKVGSWSETKGVLIQIGPVSTSMCQCVWRSNTPRSTY